MKVHHLEAARDFLAEVYGPSPTWQCLRAGLLDYAYDHRTVGDPDDFVRAYVRWCGVMLLLA